MDSDGILGLAYQAISSVPVGTPWFTTLHNQGHVWFNKFSFYFAKTGSELIIGGEDWTKFYYPVVYTPVIQQGVGRARVLLPFDLHVTHLSYQQFYSVNANVQIGGQNLSAAGSIIDTGTSESDSLRCLTRSRYRRLIDPILSIDSSPRRTCSGSC